MPYVITDSLNPGETMTLALSPALSTNEIEHFHTFGYLGPYAAVTPEEMAEIRERIEREVLTTDGPNKKNRSQCRHLDSPIVYDLCSQPAIVDRMRSLYGNDLILWASYFFTKEPGGSEIPWHQDLNYWPLEPVVNISAWMAIDPVTVENSCVRIIPGSHKKVAPHVKSPNGMAFSEMVDMNYVDTSKAINMELKPGEFFLFNEKTLHQSEPNRSKLRRMGLSMRVTLPFVKITHDIAPLFPGHAAIQLSGHDPLHFNRLVPPPTR
jgi:ectoine hydroxylase-related dioxygenase (phytanoyl-CoA dioxygenase family)